MSCIGGEYKLQKSLVLSPFQFSNFRFSHSNTKNLAGPLTPKTVVPDKGFVLGESATFSAQENSLFRVVWLWPKRDPPKRKKEAYLAFAYPPV
jgi:hypothetical protein